MALPSTINPDDVTNFQWSLSGVQNTPSFELLQSLFAHFLADNNCELLFQDSMERPSDPPSIGVSAGLEASGLFIARKFTGN